MKMMPFATMGILTTADGDRFTCLLHDSYMTTAPETLVAVFGSQMPGTYTVTGINNVTDNIDFDELGEKISKENFVEALRIFEDAPAKLLSPEGINS
jgi:hypothetical protein